MKKVLFVIAIIVTMICSANAQTDGFFREGGADNYSGRSDSPMPIVPSGQPGTIPDTDAPVGSGLLILTAAAAGYAVMRRKRSR